MANKEEPLFDKNYEFYECSQIINDFKKIESLNDKITLNSLSSQKDNFLKKILKKSNNKIIIKKQSSNS